MMARIQRLACWSAVLTVLAGCGSGVEEDPDALPFVQCSVKMAGQDVEGAIVAFHALGGQAGEIIGYYDPESSFYRFVTTEGSEKKGGVPEGEYSVTVKPGRSTKAKIPAKYADPTQSGIKAEIKKGSNLLPPFELTP